MVSDRANLVSQSASFMLNETISVLHKLNPEKLDSLKQYEGKTLEIDIENQENLLLIGMNTDVEIEILNSDVAITTVYWHLLDHSKKGGNWIPPLIKK